jgi:hypothetical protein
MKLGRGIMGVSDLGLLITFLGNKLNGGGMRCLETKIS